MLIHEFNLPLILVLPMFVCTSRQLNIQVISYKFCLHSCNAFKFHLCIWLNVAHHSTKKMYAPAYTKVKFTHLQSDEASDDPCSMDIVSIFFYKTIEVLFSTLEYTLLSLYWNVIEGGQSVTSRDRNNRWYCGQYGQSQSCYRDISSLNQYNICYLVFINGIEPQLGYANRVCLLYDSKFAQTLWGIIIYNNKQYAYIWYHHLAFSF